MKASAMERRARDVLARLATNEEGAITDAETLLAELREVLTEQPEMGRTLGPRIAQIGTAVSAVRGKSAPLVESWLPAGGGQIAIGHRPKLKQIPWLHTEGVTSLLTLLSEAEGAQEIGNAAERAGLLWYWLPLASAKPPGTDRDGEVSEMFSEIAKTLAAGAGVYIHCSAGIHRTGMVAFAMLRFLGMSADEAASGLAHLRTVTAEGVGEDRLAWGARLVE